MKYFLGALSDLTRGCDFLVEEVLIIRFLKLEKKDNRKQFCMQTLSQAEAI